MVLAAGAGRRLLPLTEALPKTLLAVDGERTILDVALANLRSAGLTDVVVVVGFAGERIGRLVPTLEERHGVRVALVSNERAQEWNNAYSLWLALTSYPNDDVMLVNGDTVHPASVEQALLEARGPDVLLAVDAEKTLGDEEMKVLLTPEGAVRRIAKHLDPAAADGEYIGVTLIESSAVPELGGALEATWRRDPACYYEDGYQELVDRGGGVHGVPIRAVEWVEVDDHVDLARAREIGCRS